MDQYDEEIGMFMVRENDKPIIEWDGLPAQAVLMDKSVIAM